MTLRVYVSRDAAAVAVGGASATTPLGASIVFFVKNPWVQGGLAAMGVTLAVWLYRIPSRDRPPREG